MASHHEGRAGVETLVLLVSTSKLRPYHIPGEPEELHFFNCGAAIVPGKDIDNLIPLREVEWSAAGRELEHA